LGLVAHIPARRGLWPTHPSQWGRAELGNLPARRKHPSLHLAASIPVTPISSNIWTMRFLLRVLVSAAALGVATWAVPGIELLAGSGWSRVGTLLAVALIFGVINATLKPLIKVVGCAFYVLTLGLIALVVNGLLLWLTSVIAGDLNLPFHVTGFWPAFWGAIIVGLVSWLLNLLIGDKRRRNDEPPPVRVVRVH
jgi:putative membrane protein